MTKDKQHINVPHLRFPEFTGEWERKSFKDVCNITTGNKNTQDKSDDGIYPFYVRSQIVERINSWTFDGEAILTAGDGVGVGKVFHYSTGKIGVHQRVYILSDFKCDGKYLYSYFAGNFYNRVKRMSAKNSVDSVRMEMIADMPISLPSTEEQKKIGHLLALLDERIATQNKIIEDLKKLKSAISVQLFNREILLGSHHNWKVMNLSDITVNFNRRNKDSIQYPMYSVTNVSGFSPQNEVFDGKEIKDEDISIYKIIHKGEFAYNPARINVGSIGRYDGEEPCMISSLYICFRPIDNINSDWLLHYLKSDKMIYKYGLYGEGGVRIYLFYPNFSRIKVLVPPFAVQKRIASIITTFNKKIRYEELLIKGYQAQKKYLQSKMFI